MTRKLFMFLLDIDWIMRATTEEKMNVDSSFWTQLLEALNDANI